MGNSFSASTRTRGVLIGDLTKCSPIERKLFQLSYYVLQKGDNYAVGKFSNKLGIKILDKKTLTSSKIFEELSHENEDKMLLNGSKDSEVAIENEVILTEEENVKCLFYILISDKPFYYSQTFSMWKTFFGYEQLFSCCRPMKRKIYIQPVNSFPDFIRYFELTLDSYKDTLNLFTLFQTFAEAFFDEMNIHLLPEINLMETNWRIKSRVHKVTGQKQFLVSDFFKNLNRVTPPDGYCIMGISWTDLYPTEDLNFVLGEANNSTKSGIFCFGRYEPKTFNVETHRDVTEMDGKLLWRLLKVFSHELCHLFGLQHCWYFHCAMNESNSMVEAFSQPLFLCPVCLRKLQYACGFDIVTRYKKLLRISFDLSLVYPTPEFRHSVQWLKKCIEFLESDVSITENV